MPSIRDLLVLTPALVLLVHSTPQDSIPLDTAHQAGPRTEPPMRARVTVGGEALEVTLGEEAHTADGRLLRVELLAERVFTVEGAFAFRYPREWSFGGAVWPDGASWSLNGEGEAIYLRRHAGDAGRVLAEHIGSLQAIGGSEPAPVSLDLGGRDLEGLAVEYDVGNIGRYARPRRWVQEVFAWSDGEGDSWLLSLQRDIGPAPTLTPGFAAWNQLELVLEPPTLVVAGEWGEVVQPALTPLARAMQGLRWLD